MTLLRLILKNNTIMYSVKNKTNSSFTRFGFRSVFTGVLYLSFLGCKAQQSEMRQVNEFSSIQCSGSVQVFYRESDTLSLEIKGSKADFEKVSTVVENATLKISNKGSFNEDIRVYVKGKNLKAVDASGASAFKITEMVKTDSISFNVSGSANVHAKITAARVKAVQSGASVLHLNGSTDELTADVTGAASLKSFNLVSKDAVVITAGAATARVHATEKVNANASGASDIKVKGEPKDVTAETTAAANISNVKIKDNTKSDGDTTTFNWKSSKIIVVKGPEDEKSENSDDDDEASFKHWRGFSVGVNGYLNPAGSINLPAKNSYMDLNYARSWNLQLNIIERQFNIVKNNMKLVTGFGFDFHLYELSRNTNLNADSTFTFGSIDTSNAFSYNKNKLRCTYLQVPLLLEFNTSNDPNKTFHIAFGVIGQYLINSRTKQILEQNDYEYKKIRKDNYNMSPFAAKAHLNIGYKGWTFFGEYSLTPLFQSGKGPELYPFAAGLRVVPFG